MSRRFLSSASKYYTFLAKAIVVLGILLETCSLTIAQSVPGPGNTVSFNGYTTSVECGSVNRGIIQRVTVEAWIRTTSSGYQWIIGKYSNSLLEEKGYHLITQNGTASFNGRADVGTYMSSGASTTRIDDGRWHHLAGVCNVDIWQIYVDGALENSRVYNYTQADLTTTSTLAIGKYYVQSENFFSGEIDEIRLWRTALLAEQIQANMCRRFSTVPADLVGYYTFDQTAGTTVVDRGNVPVNGTLQNFGSAPWKLSGAPIGDLSTSVYGSNLSQGKLKLKAANGDSAIVSGITQTDGIQLYAINQAPTLKPAGNVTATYFGVFSRGSTGTYQFRLHPAAGASSCTQIYSRSTNTDSWTAANATLSSQSLVLTAQKYRSEYIQVSSAGNGGQVNISGDELLCTGGSVKLSASLAGATAYRWNTGATTAAITVTQAGTYSVTATLAGGCTVTGTHTVVNPTIAVEADNLLCAGSSGTPLRATATPAGATFKWNTGATTATIIATKAGTYAVTATFANGCAISATRTVASPTLQLTGPALLCPGSSVQLQAQATPATATYKWNTGATTATLSATQAGTYTVVATFPNGCQLTSSTTLTTPTVQLSGESRLCANGSVTLQAAATPAAGATFLWSTGATTAAVQVTQAGTYSVSTRFPNGCTITRQQTVVRPALKLSADTLLCPNGSLRLDIQSITAGASGVKWSTGATTQAIDITKPGTYTAVATYPGGCRVEARRTVIQPRLTLSADTLLCAGAPIRLTATASLPGATYRWSTGATTASIAPTQAGLYSVTISYPGGCTLLAQRTVVQPAVAISGAAQVCQGGSVPLQATAGVGVTYRWNTGATTAAISANKPGVYTVTATYPGGCTVSTEHTVQLFRPEIQIAGDSLLCPGSSVALTAQSAGATAYRWSTGTTKAELSVAAAGTYTVTATYPSGCTASRRVTVRSGIAVPRFSLGADTTICEGTPLTLRAVAGGSYTYRWQDGSSTSTLVAQQPGLYTAQVSNACNTQTASRNVQMELCVPNIITPNGDRINDTFRLLAAATGNWSVVIFNRWGKQVYSAARYANDWGLNAAPGAYYFVLQRTDNPTTYKGWLEVVR
ncbi:gliding motility-associated C-terminal domain-containing protein [Hymenobacter sp. J193]|nr:gliding motility-associated C-terminal domain-containing protein [Hymenobacter sp. J193]